jgi:hypothetical protein
MCMFIYPINKICCRESRTEAESADAKELVPVDFLSNRLLALIRILEEDNRRVGPTCTSPSVCGRVR